MKNTFLAIGECLIEHRPNDDQLYFAGDTLNVAVYLARLAQSEVCVQYATALSGDNKSKLMKRQWQQAGIDLSAVGCVADKAVGEYWIELDQRGERSFRYQRNDSAARYMLANECSHQLIAEAVQHADMIYLSAITLAILDAASRDILYSLLLEAKHRGARIVMDNNYRASLWLDGADCCQVLQRFERVVDLVLYSLADAQAMAAHHELSAVDLIQQLRQSGVKDTVIKAAERGYWLATPGSEVDYVTVEAITEVVDSTAAGDAFNAGFLLGILRGESLNNCGCFGYRLASTVLGYSGAIIPMEAMPLL
ncbi:MAG: sugar kinase [Coxiellaceae bacterium]|nr:sugar kinase [Coxiellaceae bacterium]